MAELMDMVFVRRQSISRHENVSSDNIRVIKSPCRSGDKTADLHGPIGMYGGIS